MQKRVHFAPTNTVFSSRTPSPTLSESSSRRSEDSSSDSSSVSTPPPEAEYHHHQQQPQQQQQQQQYYPQSPFPHSHDAALQPHYAPQVHYNSPPQSFFHPAVAHSHDILVIPKSPPQHMNIHLLLAYHPETDIPLRYDLSTGFIMSHVANDDFVAAATEPPLSSLVIICPHLAWEIHVAPTPPLASSPYSPDGAVFGGEHQQRDYVTLYDVLRCLHRSLRQVVTPEEYDTLAPIGPLRDAVHAAYHTRIARIDDMAKRTRDENYGIRRIDFLQGLNMFRGLAGTLSGPNVWELNVAPAMMGSSGGMVAPVMAIAASTASVI